jgi:transposase
MTKIGRPSVWDQHQDEMARMYWEGSSRGEIAKHFGTSVQTVTRVLIKAGTEFADRPRNPNAGRTPEAQAAINAKVSAAKKGVPLGPRKPAETRECEHCHAGYEYHRGRTGERFCSRQCRTDFLVAQGLAGAQAEYELEPRRCRCGTAIPFEYRHTRQFCSPECRRHYGTKRQKEANKRVTFNCLNCGGKVTKLRTQMGYGKYCSNECAAKHTKKKQHILVEDAVVLDSPYEALFWGLCSLFKLQVERADRSQAVPIGDGWYCPDFWLPTVDLYVETKGYENEDDRARYAAWRTSGRPLLVLGRENLISLLRDLPTHGLEQELRRVADGQVF